MASHQLKVLIAEDNRVFGDVLKFNLERHGLDVTLMRTGDAAARALAEQSFDLLLTDIEMPGMRGDGDAVVDGRQPAFYCIVCVWPAG